MYVPCVLALLASVIPCPCLVLPSLASVLPSLASVVCVLAMCRACFPCILSMQTHHTAPHCSLASKGCVKDADVLGSLAHVGSECYL